MLFLVAADRATSLTLCVCTYTPLGVVVAYIYIYRLSTHELSGI